MGKNTPCAFETGDKFILESYDPDIWSQESGEHNKEIRNVQTASFVRQSRQKQ